MNPWRARRFWTTATAAPDEGGMFAVRLDDRPLRTPAKAPFRVPTLRMAEAVAGEWNAQQGEIRPATMPVTRFANTAIDTVLPAFDTVAGIVWAYAETDLTCHRAEGPAALRQRQAAAWDPLLDWAAARYGARLVPTTGIAPVSQPDPALRALRAAVGAMSPFELAALHDLVALSGSLVIGLAAADRAFPADALWAAGRIDEDWQAGIWGRDEEAAAAAEDRRRGFMQALDFRLLALA
ncbi:MAG: ATPase [Rhodobacteraceae bacterium]|nr:ATPase [Paracoccaceae bacterium]